MSALRIILAFLPSFCQKVSKLVEIWQSSDKNNFAQFFETRCICLLLILCKRMIYWDRTDTCMQDCTWKADYFYRTSNRLSCSSLLRLLINHNVLQHRYFIGVFLQSILYNACHKEVTLYQPVKRTYHWYTRMWLPGTFWGWRSTVWHCRSFGHWHVACTPTLRSTVCWQRPGRPRSIPSSVDLPALTQNLSPLPRIDRLSSDRSERSTSRWRHFRHSAAGNLHRCNTHGHHCLHVIYTNTLKNNLAVRWLESFTGAILSSSINCL